MLLFPPEYLLVKIFNGSFGFIQLDQLVHLDIVRNIATLVVHIRRIDFFKCGIDEIEVATHFINRVMIGEPAHDESDVFHTRPARKACQHMRE